MDQGQIHKSTSESPLKKVRLTAMRRGMHQAYPEHRQPPLSAEVREEKMLGKEGVMVAAPVPDPRNRTAGQITQKRFQT